MNLEHRFIISKLFVLIETTHNRVHFETFGASFFFNYKTNFLKKNQNTAAFNTKYSEGKNNNSGKYNLFKSENV